MDIPDSSQGQNARFATIYTLTHADGDIAIYAADGTFLACEATHEEAIQEARFLMSGFLNGAGWAIDEMRRGERHLQTQFPEFARRHGLA